MRHLPARIGHVAEEAPADLVTHPQRGHRPERETQESLELFDRLAALRIEEQRELRRGRELLLLAESAREPVGHLRCLLRECIAQRAHLRRIHRGHRPRACCALHHVGDTARRGSERVAIGLPSARDLRHEPREVRHRQVGEPEQGESIRSEHDVERPSRTAQRGLHEPQELRVERGVELAIDLHGDEVRVEHRRGVAVGEALALHHVAPVAREVTDGDEDQPVLGAGSRHELRAPFLPVHGVVGMQPQIGRCRVRKRIGRIVHAERRTRGDARGERQADGDQTRDMPERARSHHDVLSTRSSRGPAPLALWGGQCRTAAMRDDAAATAGGPHRGAACTVRVEIALSSNGSNDGVLTAPQAIREHRVLPRVRHPATPLPGHRAVLPGRGSPRSLLRSPARRGSRPARRADRRRTSTATP